MFVTIVTIRVVVRCVEEEQKRTDVRVIYRTASFKYHVATSRRHDAHLINVNGVFSKLLVHATSVTLSATFFFLSISFCTIFYFVLNIYKSLYKASICFLSSFSHFYFDVTKSNFLYFASVLR